MATINYAFKEISCKIVYYGAGLCGKTTNLQFIHSTVPPKFRGELISLATEQDRTLFFDFLPLDLGEVKGFKTKFQLYTVPGQVYYNATRKLVLRGVDGVVFVVDSQRERLDENIESFKNLKENLKEYGYDLESIPCVIQYNKRDLPNVFTVAELEKLFNIEKAPSYEGVATTGVGVKETLKAISSLVLKKLSAEPNEPSSVQPAKEGGKKVAAPTANSAPAANPASSALKATAASMPETPRQPERISSIKDDKPALIKSGAVAADNAKQKSAGLPAEVKISTDSLQPKKKDLSEFQTPPPDDIKPKTPIPVIPPIKKKPAEPAKKTVQISVKQTCEMYWRAIKIGTGTIEFSNRTNIDNKGDYQITGIFRSLAFRRSFWTKLPKYIGREKRQAHGEYKDYHHFYFELDDASLSKRIADIYLDAEGKTEVYIEHAGFWGKIRIAPEGKKAIV